MQFPSKKSFVRLSLVLIFALPTLAHADGDEQFEELPTRVEAPVAATPKKLSRHYLTSQQALAAFGPEFSVDSANGVFTLIGGSSEKCLQNFTISNSPANGYFQIFYKGGDDTCLKFESAVKDLPAGEFCTLADQADANMSPSGTFSSVSLVSPKPYAVRDPWLREELKSKDGESLSHISAADLAAKKRKEEEEKRKAQIDMDELLVTKCQRGLPELDLKSEAFDRLSKIESFVKEKGDDWVSDKSKEIRDQVFAACRLQILKARTDEIASANCEVRLKKIVAEDEKYLPKVKGLYLSLVDRYLNSQTMSVTEAYSAAASTIEKLRGFDLTEKEESDLAKIESTMLPRMMAKAALEGSDSEDFVFMKEKMAEYIATNDVDGCLLETGMVDPRMVRNPACGKMIMLSNQLVPQLATAQQTQLAMNQQAKEQADLQSCAQQRASGKALNPIADQQCKILESAADAKAKATLNAGISGSGFGEIVNTPSTEKSAAPADATATSASGLLNTGYAAPSAAAAPAPTATTAGTPVVTERRIFH